MLQGYCYTCLAIGGGGYFGRVTKELHFRGKMKLTCWAAAKIRGRHGGWKKEGGPIESDPIEHFQGAVKGNGPKVTERAQMQISQKTAALLLQIYPFSWKFKHLEGAGSPENLRFSQNNRSKLQIGLCHLRRGPTLGLRFRSVDSIAHHSRSRLIEAQAKHERAARLQNKPAPEN